MTDDRAPANLGPGGSAAFFFAGSFEPAELANFNVQNYHLPGEESAIFEALGHGVAIWWGKRKRQDFGDLRDATRRWLETTAGLYYLVSGTALDVRIAHWVEALTHVEAAVVGFVDARFRVITATEENEAVNAQLRRCVDVAGELFQIRHLQPAVREIWLAGVDPSDEAFLSSFRALECLRRLYQEGDAASDAEAWQAMECDLSAAQEPFRALREAAKAVRHGDRPATRAEAHPVNTARERRSELLAYARDLVRQRVERDTGSLT